MSQPYLSSPAYGLWLMAYGFSFMAHGFSFFSPLLMAYGLWLMAHGSWLLVHLLRNGSRSASAALAWRAWRSATIRIRTRSRLGGGGITWSTV